MDENIKNFCMKFFKNLGCKLEWKGEMLVVENVSRAFEEFCNKKSPYYLIFSNSCPLNENAELMTRGSLMLKLMTSFLENKGQTTLVKLDFKVTPEDVKESIKVKNCQIFKINIKPEYKYFLRFTFQTAFQYLNEMEQQINSLFVRDGQVIDFGFDKYNSVEGKKNDINIKDFSKDYEIAKLQLKKKIEPKIQKIGIELEKKLGKEIERIKKHYNSQIEEIDEVIKKDTEQIKELEAGNTNGDLKNIPARINKLKEQIDDLKKADKKEKLEQEREFFIKDETNKHSLNLDNKLINTTIIYYPVYHLELVLKNDSTRQVELVYNPLDKILSSVECESCKAKLGEISLCSSGHISCEKCLFRCNECNNYFCKACLKSCDICGKRICKKCMTRCLKCSKSICKSHMQRDSSTGREYCSTCLKRCLICGKYSLNLKKCSSCGIEMACESCTRSNAYCTNCFKKCTSCGKTMPKSSFTRCSSCKYKECNYPGKCLSCRKQLCARLKH